MHTPCCRLRGVLTIALVSLLESAAWAQPTSATLFGAIVDAQGRVVPGASISLQSLETGQVRATTSDEGGRFRLLGLSPGPQAFHAELAGFEPCTTTVTLTVGEDVRLDATLHPAALRETISVSTAPTLLDAAKTVLGRTTTQDELDTLPVAGRDFTSLASLTPGILANQASAAPASSGIVSAGQTGRSNTFLLDGLNLDLTYLGAARGGVPLDAVREFFVLTNGYTAEYGQASGAIVSVLTRSGTNRFSGRGTYLHRDDRWDARSAAARLVFPPSPTAPFEQKTAGGSIGGPIAPNRAFFFGAVEGTLVDTAYLVATPLLATYRPDDPSSVPQRRRRWLAFGRGDADLRGDGVTWRYRLDRIASPGTVFSQSAGIASPETRNDGLVSDQELGGVHNHVWGGRGFNELRLQFVRHELHLDRGAYCLFPCPAFFEDRPGIKLGTTAARSASEQTYWQVSDILSIVRSGPRGEHTMSAGADSTFVRGRFRGANNEGGTFTFRTDAPFDAMNPRTYPFFFTQNLGDPDVRLAHAMVTLFAQDRWTARPRLTLNLGIRWQYDSMAGSSHDWNNIAPRVGLAYSPERGSPMVMRASYGVYYDQPLLAIVHQFEQAQQTTQLFVGNPGYPDWRGANPNRGDLTPLSTVSTRQLGALQTPSSEQATLGLQRPFRGLRVSVDGVWARGRELFETRDLNAPDSNGRRPDPRYQFVRVVESRGRSLYKGLQVGLLKRYARGHLLSAAYTLASAERDTEDFDFTPQDQRDFAAERGPGASDVRHQFVGNGSAELPLRVRLGLVLTAHGGSPYTVITGVDNNRDGTINDRPAGVSRNSERGAGFLQLNARAARPFRIGRVRLDLIAEAFNLTNRANWTAYDGVQASTTFGRPHAASIARQIQLGARVEF